MNKTLNIVIVIIVLLGVVVALKKKFRPESTIIEEFRGCDKACWTKRYENALSSAAGLKNNLGRRKGFVNMKQIGGPRFALRKAINNGWVKQRDMF